MQVPLFFPGCGEAVLIAGDSGSGKSTVLMEAVSLGATLIAEDACSVRLQGSLITVSGFAGQLQLREGRDEADRRAVDVPREQQRRVSRAKALIVLNPSGDRAAEFPKLLKGAEALQAILRNRYRPVVARLLGREAPDLSMWAELSKELPVYSWNPRLIASCCFKGCGRWS